MPKLDAAVDGQQKVSYSFLFNCLLSLVVLAGGVEAEAQYQDNLQIVMLAQANSAESRDLLEAEQRRLREMYRQLGAMALIPVLRGADSQQRQIAADILGEKFRRAVYTGQHMPGQGQAVQVLVELSETSDIETRRHALEALGFYGNNSAVVIDSLLRSLASKEGEISFRSAKALGVIGPGALRAVPALIQALGRKAWIEGFVRAGAARSLGQLSDTRSIAPLTRAVETDEYWETRKEAAWALGRFGPVARSAVPGLIKALTYRRHWRVRYHAAQALGLIGDASAVPALSKAYQTESLQARVCDLPTKGGCRQIAVNSAAKKALEQIGTPEALRALGFRGNGGSYTTAPRRVPGASRPTPTVPIYRAGPDGIKS